MKKIIFLLIVFSCLFACNKDKCESGKIPFDDECIIKGDKTFYFGYAGFHCLPDSLAIGIDFDKKKNVCYYRDRAGFIQGQGDYSLDEYPFYEECKDKNAPFGFWFVFTKIKNFDSLKPDSKSIKLDLFLKAKPDFETETYDSTSIVLYRR